MKETMTQDSTSNSNKPKVMIANAIKEGLKTNKISVRAFASSLGMNHPQIIRITNGENYNIDTLIKVLDSLDLEITIRPKKESNE